MKNYKLYMNCEAYNHIMNLKRNLEKRILRKLRPKHAGMEDISSRGAHRGLLRLFLFLPLLPFFRPLPPIFLIRRGLN